LNDEGNVESFQTNSEAWVEAFRYFDDHGFLNRRRFESGEEFYRAGPRRPPIRLGAVDVLLKSAETAVDRTLEAMWRRRRGRALSAAVRLSQDAHDLVLAYCAPPPWNLELGRRMRREFTFARYSDGEPDRSVVWINSHHPWGRKRAQPRGSCRGWHHPGELRMEGGNLVATRFFRYHGAPQDEPTYVPRHAPPGIFTDTYWTVMQLRRNPRDRVDQFCRPTARWQTAKLTWQQRLHARCTARRLKECPPPIRPHLDESYACRSDYFSNK
jgi:hypothetical protein